MPVAPTVNPPIRTLDDLVTRLGSVPLDRIRFHPFPGTALEADVSARPDGEKRLCELVEGVLVDKAIGFYESVLAAVLIELLRAHVRRSDLGIVLGADAALLLAPGLVRSPDVSFISWDRLPGRMIPAAPVPALAPDLAVEVLSAANTPAEMNRKLVEYFAAGVILVWCLDPKTKTARVYAGPDRETLLDEAGVLDGGSVIPGFSLRVGDWFEQAGPRQSGK